jgi:hypothetical protein
MPQVFDVLCVKSPEPDWMTATQKQIYNLIFSIVHETNFVSRCILYLKP